MIKKKKNGNKSKSSFISNLARSGKSLLSDTANDMMPNLSSAIKKNARFTKTTYTNFKDKYKETDIKDSYLYQSGTNLIKNTISDIKSGNLNNKERVKKNTDDPFEKLLNFDFDDENSLSEAFKEEAPGGMDSEPTISEVTFDADTKSDLSTIANFSKTSTTISNRGFAMVSTQLRNITQFQVKNTLKFYDMIEEKLNAMENHLNISSAYYKDVVENNNKSMRKSADPRSLEKAFGMTGFNIEDWVDIYKQNLNDMKSVGGLVGGMMLKPMITNFVNNPVGTLAKMGLKSLIPKGIKNSLTDFDKTFGMLPILLQSKIPKLKEKGGIGGFLAGLLDLNKNRVKSDKNAFVKGPISFDGVTKRAITHVIPGYLKRILFAITGNEKDRISYDMDKGRFVTDKDAKENYRKRINASTRFNIDDNIDILESEYVKSLKSKKVIKDDKDASKYVEELRSKLGKLSKSGKTLASDLKLSDLSNDKKTAKILKDIIENKLSVKGRNEVNKAMAESYMAYQEELRNSTAEELWSSVFDQGTYSAKAYSNNKIDTDKFSLFEDKLGQFNKKKDEILKGKLYEKVKNEKIKGLIDKAFKTKDDGKNEYIEDFIENHIYSKFKGSEIVDDGSLDRKTKKRRAKNVYKGEIKNDSNSIVEELKKLNALNTLDVIGLDPNSNAAKRVLRGLTSKKPGGVSSSLTSVITNSKAGVTGLNRGLYQYSTMTSEGLALRVKVVGGTLETTEGVSDPSNIEKNEKSKDKVFKKRKKNNKDNTSPKGSKKNKKKDRKKKRTGPGLTGSNDSFDNTDSSSSNDSYGIGDLFADITGEDLSKDGVKNLITGKVKGAVEGTKYGGLVTKYGSSIGKFLASTTLGRKILRKEGMAGQLFNSASGLGKSLLNRGKQAFGFGKSGASQLLNSFKSKTGIDKSFLKSSFKKGLLYSGGKATGLMNGLNDLVSGKKGFKDSAKSFLGGAKGTLKELTGFGKSGASKIGKFFEGGRLSGFKSKVGELFRKNSSSIIKHPSAGGLVGGKTSGISPVIRKAMGGKPNENSHIVKTPDGTEVVINDKNNSQFENKLVNAVEDSLEPVNTSLNNVSIKVSNSLDNLTETVNKSMEDVSETIEKSAAVIESSNKESSGGSGGGLLGNLLSSGKGLLGKAGSFLAGKGGKIGKIGGLLSKLGGGASAAAGAASGGSGILGGLAGLGGTAGSLLGGLGSGLGSLVGGIGSAGSAVASAAGGIGSSLLGGGLASGAGSLLMSGLGMLAPMALPIAGIAAAGYGIKKLFDWRKKKKQEEEYKKYLGSNDMYQLGFDPSDTGKEDSEDTEGYLGKLASHRGKELLNPIANDEFSMFAEDTGYLLGNRKVVKRDSNGRRIYDKNGKAVLVDGGSRIGSFFGKIFGGNSSETNTLNQETSGLSNPNREGLNQLSNNTSSEGETTATANISNDNSSINSENNTGEATVVNNTVLSGPSPNVNDAITNQPSTIKRVADGYKDLLLKSMDYMPIVGPIKAMFSLFKKHRDKEQKLGEKSDDPMTRVASYLKPVGEFAKSGHARSIFGPTGLFGSMFKGLKQAAGGSLSKLAKFFKGFWSKTSGSSEDGSGGTSLGGGGINGSESTATDYLGIYSNKNEGSVGTISSGAGDYGGPSYGIPQFPLNQGTPGRFVDWMSKKYPQYGKYFAGTKQGTSAFNAAWKKLAQDDPDGFTKVQVEYAVEQDVKPFMDKKPGGIDWNRSRALQEVAYSRAVHMGPGLAARAVKNAGITSSDNDATIINKFYDECKRNVKSYWKSSPGSWNGLVSRFDREKQDMLKLAATNKGPINWAAGPGSSGGGSSNAQVRKVLSTAKAMIDAGYPYKLESGAVSPSYGAFDCSGLVQYSYKQAGISLPRLTYDQVKMGKAVPMAGKYGLQNAQPGDLLFTNRSSRGPEHVMIYEGNNMVLEAANPRTGLVHRSINYTDFPKRGCNIRRIIGGLNQGDSDLVYGAGNISSSTDFRSTKELIKEYRKYNNVPGIKAKPGALVGGGDVPKTGGLKQGSGSVKVNDTLRNNERNSMLLRIRDALDKIEHNTGETNKLLTKILENLVNKFNTTYTDEPLVLSPEITALFKGI